MGSQKRATSAVVAAFHVLLVGTLYFVAAGLGQSMARVAPPAMVVWPPTGIALAALLLLGRRVWPGIALGAFLANLSAPHQTVATACGIAAGNTLEAIVAVWALEQVGFRTPLNRLRDVLALIAIAVGSSIVSPTIAVATLGLAGTQGGGARWWVWWVGGAIGDLVLAPLLLVLGSKRSFSPRPRRLLEAVALLAVVVVVTGTVFTIHLGGPTSGRFAPYTIFPFVIWGALRFNQRGTATITFVAAIVAIWSTANGWGPFAAGGSPEGFILLQLFMTVVAATGLLLGAALAERDLAERRAAADYEQLRASERRLRVALDAGRMGVWDWNIATGKVTWSENLEPIHGLPRGSFGGTFESFEALIHPEDREFVKRAITGALEDGTGYDLEFRNGWPDGSVHWVAAKGTVLRDAAGKPVRMIGVATDVTDRRHLEEELRRRAGELADADRRKDEFLAMLAHELRNPLTAITNALHLIALGAPESERFLEVSNRQVKQLVRLVDDLLDVARITQGKIALRKEMFPLGEAVAAAVETVRALVDARGHALTVSLPPRPIELEADRARLAQVLANLLGNAAKYTPPGGSIWVTAERLADQVVIRVRDTGVGLEPELLPHVFDLFVQGNTAPDRAPGGLGIGLTIVRRLVEMHGGTVEASSPGVGLGAEFVLRLPVGMSREETTTPIPIVPPSSAGLRVLVVEDNELTAESLALVLRLWGHEVYVAPDAVEALELAAHHEPNVIVSDIGLPGMDGYELARRLRAGPSFGGAVLIALTGYGREEDKRRALDAGFDHHLVKPPDLEALAHLLGRADAGTIEQRGRTLH